MALDVKALKAKCEDNRGTTRRINPDTVLTLIALLEQAGAALAKMTSEPDSLAYPERDVYGFNGTEDDRDADAPLWTEAGLYGRVGKDAARTLLGRHDKACAALAALRAAGVDCRGEK